MTRVIPSKGKKVINPENLKTVPKEGIVVRESGIYWTHWKKQEKEGGVKFEKITHKKSSKKQNEESK